MIQRPYLREAIARALRRAPICYVAGPRQAGKTTLAREFLDYRHSAYFDLEDPETESRLSAGRLALSQDTPLTVIDEIQRRPDLFPLLRVLADSPDRKTSYLILGSSSPGLLKGVSESLAGRVELVEVGGFEVRETGMDSLQRLQLRGGFPRSFLAKDEEDSLSWRKNFLTLVVEKDMPQLGASSASAVLLRLWSMIAHYHGQVWNATEPARSLGISESTVRRMVDLFEGLYLVRVLRPWHENLSKRQVKSPKLYIRDSGLLHVLLGIRTIGDLVSHPKAGASWEGFVIEQILRLFEPDDAAFWATHNGAELDLLLFKGQRRFGFEVKLNPAPRITPSMRIAMNDLRLDRLWVVHPGDTSWPLDDSISALSVTDLFRMRADSLVALATTERMPRPE